MLAGGGTGWTVSTGRSHAVYLGLISTPRVTLPSFSREVEREHQIALFAPGEEKEGQTGNCAVLISIPPSPHSLYVNLSDPLPSNEMHPLLTTDACSQG